MVVFDNNSLRRILSVRHRDFVPTVNLRRRLCLTSVPALLVKGKPRCIWHAANVLIDDLFLPTPPRMWRTRAGGQLKTLATTIKADLQPISRPQFFGNTRWRKDWVKVSSELVQDRRA